MKKTKIFAISSVLMLLLTACGSSTTGTDDSKDPGFTYIPPTGTFEDDFNPEINFDGNDIIKNLFLTTPKDDDTLSVKEKWRKDVIDNIDQNQIVPNKVTYNLTDYEKRDYGGLSVNNKEIVSSYSIKRDNDNLTKTGTFDIYKKTFSKKNVEGKDVVVADDIIDVDGKYSYIPNIENQRYEEKFDYTDASKQDQINEGVLTSTNLTKAMILSDLTSFKMGYKKLIDSFNPEASTSEWSITSNHAIEKVGSDIVNIKFTIEKLTKANPGEPDKKMYSDIETFKVAIHKDGYVSEAYHFHEFSWKNSPDPSKTSLEKFEEKYTFSIEK